ncbi:MAG: potassium-transporting ATPase subunit KdpC [Gemmataceae bacterium]|nr:potassium-transporting ATPase subunit KdpC [Gemmataceae bacterium]
MTSQLRALASVFGVLMLVTGLVYPLLVTAVAQVVFPHRANGSLIEKDGKVVGSELIGQSFDDERYFWSRPSATSPVGYNAASSTGSNFGPTNPFQLDAVKQRVESLRKAHPDQSGPVPADLVTASASGLDPHISPAAAEYQVTRVAKARGLSEERVRQLVAKHTDGRTLGLLGEPRVNVLRLNLALDAESTNPR